MKEIIRKFKTDSILILVIAMIVSGMNIIGATLLGELLNAAVDHSTGELVKSSFTILAVWGLWYVLNKVRNDYNVKFKSKCNTYMRNICACNMSTEKKDEWEKKAPSEYVGVFTSEIEMIDNNAIDALTDLMYSIFTLLFSICALFFIHWSVVLVSAVMFAVMTFLPELFTKKINDRTAENARQNEMLTKVLSDCLYGRNEYTGYQAADMFTERIKKSSGLTENSRVQLDKTMNFVEMCIGVVGFVFQVILIFVVALLALNGITKVGAVLTVGNLAGTFTQSASTLINDMTKIKGNNRLIPYLKQNEKTEQINNPLPVRIYELTKIQLPAHVVNYSRLNMTFETGGKYLITGESGKGKSTILKMLFQRNLAYQGTVTANDRKRNEISCECFDECVCYVDQFCHIFNDSIRNNLCMGKEISEKQLKQIIHDMSLDTFFHRCNDSLDYVIDDQGSNISGGEKQRLCLARAMLSGKKIIVLDEPFSSMDHDNIRQILQFILSRKDLTVIMTAHNIETSECSNFTAIYKL